MTDPDKQIEIAIRVRVGRRELPVKVINISCDDVSFTPLPKDHDAIWGDHHHTRHTRAERDRAALFMAKKLTDAILDLVNAQDPKNGYTPDENEQFHGPLFNTEILQVNGTWKVDRTHQTKAMTDARLRALNAASAGPDGHPVDRLVQWRAVPTPR